MNANKLLYYYKNEKEKKPIKDPIKLDNCKCVEANLNHERFKFVFSVVLPQRIYYLVAGTQLEMEDWVDKLIEVCGFKRTDELCHSQGKINVTKHYTSNYLSHLSKYVSRHLLCVCCSFMSFCGQDCHLKMSEAVTVVYELTRCVRNGS